jgi:hypothetical protein
MCWSEEVSWYTFLIGSIVCFTTGVRFSYHQTIPTLCVGWEISVVMIQYYEANIWHAINNYNNYMFGSYGVVFTVFSQPIIMGVCLMATSGVSSDRKKTAASLIIGYLYWCLYSISSISPLQQLSTFDATTCNHIDFAYWNDLWYADYFYTITLISQFILLIDEIDLALVLTMLYGSIYVFTYLLYNCGESFNGSPWCWASSLMMGFIGLYQYLAHEKGVKYRPINKY